MLSQVSHYFPKRLPNVSFTNLIEFAKSILILFQLTMLIVLLVLGSQINWSRVTMFRLEIIKFRSQFHSIIYNMLLVRFLRTIGILKWVLYHFVRLLLCPTFRPCLILQHIPSLLFLIVWIKTLCTMVIHSYSLDTELNSLHSIPSLP